MAGPCPTSIWPSLVVVTVCLLATADAFSIHFVFEEPSITCWTCPNKSNNEDCNNWAPDFPCLTNMTVCKTIHRIELASRRTLNVYKQCAKKEDCSAESVGCHDTDIPGVQDCVSCCTDSYCNEAVPTDEVSAIRLSTVTNSATTTARHWSPLLPITAVLCSILARHLLVSRES